MASDPSCFVCLYSVCNPPWLLSSTPATTHKQCSGRAFWTLYVFFFNFFLKNNKKGNVTYAALYIHLIHNFFNPLWSISNYQRPVCCICCSDITCPTSWNISYTFGFIFCIHLVQNPSVHHIRADQSDLLLPVHSNSSRLPVSARSNVSRASPPCG